MPKENVEQGCHRTGAEDRLDVVEIAIGNDLVQPSPEHTGEHDHRGVDRRQNVLERKVRNLDATPGPSNNDPEI
ncbi:hypothetical protein GCM10007857_52540 [Bradyrhizobium iriomotense]|uniref:Transposase n=1 Tax=Bradyrhizobium iriomotense TaxID=441950 RepID=A0ABQ6B2A6_9BRAD|nr:hypothetical protein GCM10007857_52540 [Bradyrhizobium iriomotense]